VQVPAEVLARTKLHVDDGQSRDAGAEDRWFGASQVEPVSTSSETMVLTHVKAENHLVVVYYTISSSYNTI